jgi:hypothetical protein
MPKNYDLIELIRQKRTMSQDITRKDNEYSQYAGAPLELASEMATLNTFLKLDLLPLKLIPLLKLYRIYLNQQRKAIFAGARASEVTILGFILGDTQRVISATAPG